MNQDEYILKTITGERDDLLEINEQLKFERKNLKQQLSQKDEMVKSLETKLALAVKGLEFYACKNNWRKNSGGFYIENDRGSYTTIAFIDIEQREIREMLKNQVGGKLARKTLAEIKEK